MPTICLERSRLLFKYTGNPEAKRSQSITVIISDPLILNPEILSSVPSMCGAVSFARGAPSHTSWKHGVVRPSACLVPQKVKF